MFFPPGDSHDLVLDYGGGFFDDGLVVTSAFGPMPFKMAFDWFGGRREMILIISAIS